jgi:hypothetical protein
LNVRDPHFDEAKFRETRLAEWCRIEGMRSEYEWFNDLSWREAENEVMIGKIRALGLTFAT